MLPSRLKWLPLFVVLSLLPLGCGPGTPTVSGVVTFNDRALTSGTVLFHAPDRTEHALIGPDGRYTVVNVPPGPVRISVRSHAAMPLGMPGAGKAPATPAELRSTETTPRDGKFVSIPARYADPERSQLTCTVREGAQTYDIPLKP